MEKILEETIVLPDLGPCNALIYSPDGVDALIRIYQVPAR